MNTEFGDEGVIALFKSSVSHSSTVACAHCSARFLRDEMDYGGLETRSTRLSTCVVATRYLDSGLTSQSTDYKQQLRPIIYPCQILLQL